MWRRVTSYDRAFRASFRNPDAATVFIAVLLGAIMGAVTFRFVAGTTIGRATAATAVGAFVAFCIYGAGCTMDAVTREDKKA